MAASNKPAHDESSRPKQAGQPAKGSAPDQFENAADGHGPNATGHPTLEGKPAGQAYGREERQFGRGGYPEKQDRDHK